MARRFGNDDDTYGADDGTDPTAPVEDQVDDLAEMQHAADVSTQSADEDNDVISQLVGDALVQSQAELSQRHTVALMRSPRQESVVQGMISKMKLQRATTHLAEEEQATAQQKRVEEGFEEYMLKDITESVAD